MQLIQPMRGSTTHDVFLETMWLISPVPASVEVGRFCPRRNGVPLITSTLTVAYPFGLVDMPAVDGTPTQ